MAHKPDSYLLVAKLRSVKTIIQLLKAINFQEFATCFASTNGLKVTVEIEKCMQASAYIPSQAFEEFNLQEDVVFRINLSVLVECLSMSWGSKVVTTNAFQLLYKGHGNPVTILLEEDDVITECHLKCQEATELLDFRLDPQNVVNKVVLQTDLLKDVMTDLDPTSEYLELVLSPKPPFFRIITDGLTGICHIDFPHESELIDSFECSNKTSTCYRLNHIKLTLKGLACASKVSMRTDNRGLLCLQYMVKGGSSTICYIEYYVSPVINSDDD